jgi:hypothetical protein
VNVLRSFDVSRLAKGEEFLREKEIGHV